MPSCGRSPATVPPGSPDCCYRLRQATPCIKRAVRDAVWLLRGDGAGLAGSGWRKHGGSRWAPAKYARCQCSYAYVGSVSGPAGLALPPVRHPMVERRQSGRFHRRVTITHSPARGKGADLSKLFSKPLPGCEPGYFTGAAPDVGALQFGQPMPRIPRRPEDVDVPPAGIWPGP